MLDCRKVIVCSHYTCPGIRKYLDEGKGRLGRQGCKWFEELRKGIFGGGGDTSIEDFILEAPVML